MARAAVGKRGTLVRDARGVAVHHVAFGVSLYAKHALCLVNKADPRGDGRPPRVLAVVRVALGFQDLVGVTPLDASLMIATAVVRALADGTDSMGGQPPEPPAGATGAALQDPLRTDTLPGL